MNQSSYSCYITYKETTNNFYPSWMVAERYNFCDNISRFFSRKK